MRKVIYLILLAPLVSMGPGADPQLKIEQVMTTDELRDTGIASLSASQRRALDRWLNRYTTAVSKVAPHLQAESPRVSSVQSNCSPAIESTIAGETEGWSGETIFKLDNGQIWEQAEYSYNYFYAYRPEVTIYPTQSGCRMKVEDEQETILVKRIR